MRNLPAPVILLLLAVFIGLFGAGLTAPIWLVFMGGPMAQAQGLGLTISLATTVLIAVLIALAFFTLNRDKAGEAPDLASAPLAGRSGGNSRSKHWLVQTITLLMFLIPFATVATALLYDKVFEIDTEAVDSDPGDAN